MHSPTQGSFRSVGGLAQWQSIGPVNQGSGVRSSQSPVLWRENSLREPGIEPGPTPWQGAILPLDHSRCTAGGAVTSHIAAQAYAQPPVGTPE